MDPEVIAAIQDNIRSIAQQGGTPAQIDAYLKGEGFATRQEWLDASDMRTPAIPEGNALGDFIATFGNSAALGIPRLLSNTVGSGEFDARLDFLEENNPGTSALVGLGGAGLTGGAALRGGARVLAGGTRRQAAQRAAQEAARRRNTVDIVGGGSALLPSASAARSSVPTVARSPLGGRVRDFASSLAKDKLARTAFGGGTGYGLIRMLLDR